ncbi:MAG: hypothetical protein HY356_05655 [Gammaproteobacteria bacterium]|nr:hypothetical protein [Gammaproteobacteria bacterium]
MRNSAVFNKERERPVSHVPKIIIAFLSLALVIQITWHAARPPVIAQAEMLPVSPPGEKLELISMGDPVALSKIIMLWLQAFDNQPGISIPFKQLDYVRVISWLEKVLFLDRKGQYPLLAASRLYTEVPDDMKKRQMLEFVFQQFFLDPNRRWPSLAHAVYVAKHRLRDLPLALRYAHALAQNVTLEDIPHWVKQMEIYVLEDMGEIESAKILIGGLLDSGAITDPHELGFLQDRLEKLEAEKN